MSYEQDNPTITFRVHKDIRNKLVELANERKISLQKYMQEFVESSLKDKKILKVKYEFDE